MQLPISIGHDSLQYHTSVLIDSEATLNFASHEFSTRNDPMGKCTSGPKIVVRIANEQRISMSKICSHTKISLGHKMLLVSTSQFYHTLNVLILSLVYQQ